MRPLLANPKRASEAAKFHREVFAVHGKGCYFCGGNATDAMHIVPRSQLGKQRYACAPENGRPGCRRCHELQEIGTMPFRKVDIVKAIRALNKVLKAPLKEPA